MSTYLYSMIISIRDDILPNPVDSDSCKAVELAFSVSILSKLLDKLAVSVENLYAVVGRIRDHYRVVRAHGHAARPREKSGLAPPTPYLEQLYTFLQVPTPRGGTYRCRCDT